METLPFTPAEYRAWWTKNTDVPFGYCWCGCGQKTSISPVNHRSRFRVMDQPVRFLRGHGGAKPAPDGMPNTAKEYYEWWTKTRPDVPYGFCWCGCGRETALAPETQKRSFRFAGEPHRFIKEHGNAQHPVSPVDYIVKDTGHETPCWLWQRNLNYLGYGIAYCPEKRRQRFAHRHFYEKEHGPIPHGLVIDHLCRQPACVNPTHLEAVTHRENLRRGKNTKLTTENVKDIRALYATGKFSTIKIGKWFNVSPSHVSRICLGKSWRVM